MLLKDKVVLITGATRGIGAQMAKTFAQHGAKIVVTGKSQEPHPKLPGTLKSVSQEIEQLGAQALPIALDVREEAQIQQCVQKATDHFGRLDILVNNAGAIRLTPSLHTPMKSFDLMMGINARATFACSIACVPFLQKAPNPHILNMSPPINMNKRWFEKHLAYTLSKYNMSLCTLGMAEEYKSLGIAVNSLWPKTTIATAAIEYNFPKEILQASRSPEIVALAALKMVTQDSQHFTGQCVLDEDFLKTQGIEDFSEFANDPNVPLMPDLFLDEFRF